jgi:hypothetical protein
MRTTSASAQSPVCSLIASKLCERIYAPHALAGPPWRMKTGSASGPLGRPLLHGGASAASTVSVTCEFAVAAGRFQPRHIRGMRSRWKSATRPGQRLDSSYRDCPFDTGVIRPMWHAGGHGGRGRIRLGRCSGGHHPNLRVRPVRATTCLVGKHPGGCAAALPSGFAGLALLKAAQVAPFGTELCRRPLASWGW